jgi:hypothetical protein
MPLAFPSLSHGTVAFGFYNVETDGLLLERLFFFCTDFCGAVCALADGEPDSGARSSVPGFAFARGGDIGDLMGAIRGTTREGFLGEVYRLWPFPEDPGAFRQKLHGASNRPAVEELLRRFARPVRVSLEAESGGGPVSIGEYRFSRAGFLALIDYVWRGGYPTWEGFEQGRRPPEVARLAAAARRLGVSRGARESGSGDAE